MNLGSSIRINGELGGSEDLTVNGEVDGSIHLPDHTLTIGPDARVNAQIVAESVVVLGVVYGMIIARGKIQICNSGRVEAELVAQRIAIHEGAFFRGSINMPAREATVHESPMRTPRLVAV